MSSHKKIFGVGLSKTGTTSLAEALRILQLEAAHFPEWILESRAPDYLKAVVWLHNAAVQQYFKGRPRDLLIFNISRGDGWEALCDFLGKDIPSQRFPHANKSL